MAEKRLGPINVDIIANSSGVTKVAKQVGKDMASIKAAVKSVDVGGGSVIKPPDPVAVQKSVAAIKAAQKAIAAPVVPKPQAAAPVAPVAKGVDDLNEFDNQIASTILNLQKLKTDAANGIDIKTNGAEVANQFNKLLSSSAASAHQAADVWQQVYGKATGAAEVQVDTTKSIVNLTTLDAGIEATLFELEKLRAKAAKGVEVKATIDVPDTAQLKKVVPDKSKDLYDIVGDYEIKPLLGEKKAKTKVEPEVKTDKAKNALVGLDDQIKATIANLYKLKADAAKGLDVKITAGQIDKQLSKILNSSALKPEDTRSLLQKIKDFKPGKTGGELIKKITGAELVPEALAENPFVVGASVGLLGAKAVGTAGVVNRNAFERDKEATRAATTGDQLTNVVESLPVVGGIFKSLKTDLMDAFSSVNQQTEVMKGAQEQWLQLEEKRKAIKQENKQIERETAAIMFKGLQDYNAIGNRGGKKGRSNAIEDNFKAIEFQATQAKDSALEGINSKRSAYNTEYGKNTVELKNLANNSTDKNVRQTANEELKRLAAEKKAFEGQLTQQTKEVGERFNGVVTTARKTADKQKAINEGKIADQDGIDNTKEQVDIATRTMGVDDIDSMRKQFAELKPDPKAIADFNVQLDALKAKQKEIAGQQLWKQMSDALKDYGLSIDEVTAKRLVEGGKTEAQAKALIEAAKESSRVSEGKNIWTQLQEDAKNYGLTADEVTKRKLVAGGKTEAQADAAIYSQKSSVTIANSKALLDTSGAYLSNKENILSELGKAGADGAYVARVKLALDTTEAGQRYQQFREQIKNLTVSLAVEAAGLDENKRRNAQIDAEASKDLEGVTDPTLISERRAQAEALKQKEQQLSDAQKANQFTDAADTTDKFQRVAEQIGDLLQKGLISEDTARNRLSANQADYDSANMPRNNPDMLSYDSGALQRLVLSQTQGYTDSANPELTEARKSNQLLEDIKKGLTPKMANI